MYKHSNFSVSHQNLFSVLLIAAILLGMKGYLIVIISND